MLAATAAGRSAGVTSVVGFGGGSPMDVAKLTAYLLGSGDQLDDIWGVGLATSQRLPLVLVPTTAGTGSEATPISVITCEGGVKLAVNSAPLIADWAVLDATLTLGLPKPVTAATGIDAIVHAVEAYTSARLKNPLSDALAREALRLLSSNLLAAIEQPRIWMPGRQCCLARISPDSLSPTRRSPAYMLWRTRSAGCIICPMA